MTSAQSALARGTVGPVFNRPADDGAYALSLHQPYGTLVVLGIKQIETRRWHTAVRGPLWIHAAQRWSQQQRDLCQTEPFARLLAAVGYGDPDTLPRGGLIGAVQLTDCKRIADGWQPDPWEAALGDFRELRYAWFLQSPRQLPRLLPHLGRQSLWRVQVPTDPGTAFDQPRCRVCGCTDDDCSQCIAATGEPCSWAEHDLCSRCDDSDV